MRAIIVLIVIVMAALTYGEHAYGDPYVRKLAHYVFDGLHICWLYLLLLASAFLGMKRGRWRLVLVGASAWGATEGAMTGIAGMIGDPRVIPSQWSGWLGEMLRLPLAAIGLSAFLVFVASIWGPNE